MGRSGMRRRYFQLYAERADLFRKNVDFSERFKCLCWSGQLQR